MKYIDADRLRAEIERRKKEHMYNEMPITIGRYYEDRDLLAFIDFDLQEQPEVELDFQAFSNEMNAVFNLPKDITENTEENQLNWEYAIARHFFDLGRLNARKEE
jgi:hypothetical protein